MGPDRFHHRGRISCEVARLQVSPFAVIMICISFALQRATSPLTVDRHFILFPLARPLAQTSRPSDRHKLRQRS